jgi:hypothetical protein
MSKSWMKAIKGVCLSIQTRNNLFPFLQKTFKFAIFLLPWDANCLLSWLTAVAWMSLIHLYLFYSNWGEYLS